MKQIIVIQQQTKIFQRMDSLQRDHTSSNNFNKEGLQLIAQGANSEIYIEHKSGRVIKRVFKKNQFRRIISYAKLTNIINLVEAQKIDPKHLIKIISFQLIDRTDWHYSMVMEKADMSLQEFIDRSKYNPQEEGHNFYISIFIQLIEALNQLHKNGLSYNDLKPQNVVLVGRLVKFCDIQSISSIKDELQAQIGNITYSHFNKLDLLKKYAESVQRYQMHSLSMILFELFEKQISLLASGLKKMSESQQNLSTPSRQNQNGEQKYSGYKIETGLKNDLRQKQEYKEYELAFSVLQGEPVLKTIISNLYNMKYKSLDKLLASNDIQILRKRLKQANYVVLEKEEHVDYYNESLQILKSVGVFIINTIVEEQYNKENLINQDGKSLSNQTNKQNIAHSQHQKNKKKQANQQFLPLISRKEATTKQQSNLLAELLAKKANILFQNRQAEIKIKNIRKIANFFINADKNGNGEISYKQFKRFFRSINDNQHRTKGIIHCTFNAIDENKNGSISISEYSQIFSNILSQDGKQTLKKMLDLHYSRNHHK